jgi:hypothetical protein
VPLRYPALPPYTEQSIDSNDNSVIELMTKAPKETEQQQ